MSIIHFFSLGVIMCNINSALGIEFNLLSFMGKLFKGKLNRPVYKRWRSRRWSRRLDNSRVLSEEEHDNKSKNTFISSAVVANEMVSYLKHI